MASSIARVDVVVDACRVDLVVGDAEAGRGDLDPVETGERVAHGGVAALAHVVDQLADRRPQRRIEDLVEPPRPAARPASRSDISAHRRMRITAT